MDKLIEGLSILNIEASGRKLEKLETYMNELELWNSRLNLVSVKGSEEIIVRHILDCLAGLKIIEQFDGKSIADIGSGAGLPGLLLAIFLEDRTVALIERSGKKAGFLRSTTAILGMVDRVDIIEEDLKSVKGRFDIITLRAFREFGDFYKSMKAITAENGCIAAYKGRMNSILSDLKAVKLDAEKVETIELEVPFLEEDRHLLVINPYL